MQQRDLHRRQRDSSSNGTRRKHWLQRCNMRPCLTSVRNVHVCSLRYDVCVCVYVQSLVAKLCLFTKSNSVTLRPPRLGQRLQHLWWPASLRFRSASPNWQGTVLMDLDSPLCKLIHFKITHSERTKSEVSCWICPTYSWPTQWTILLDIFKNNGIQFRMGHLCHDWHIGVTLIPSLKSVETKGWLWWPITNVNS